MKQYQTNLMIWYHHEQEYRLCLLFAQNLKQLKNIIDTANIALKQADYTGEMLEMPDATLKKFGFSCHSYMTEEMVMKQAEMLPHYIIEYEMDGHKRCIIDKKQVIEKLTTPKNPSN